MNNRSPHTTGDAEPRPGTSTFHLTFFDSLHSSGGDADRETPLASGPRHCGQNLSPGGSVAGAEMEVTDSTAATAAAPDAERSENTFMCRNTARDAFLYTALEA
jgi:hypothetical protein